MPKLVIVESPAKAKTIGKYLGRGYKVTASMGHVRDLPASTLGIDVENGYTPKYITIKGKQKLVKELKAEAKKCDGVLLATDPDREGEAISWHLANILGLDPSAPNRVTFDEITKKGVKEGMAHPRAINIDLFNAQQARRELDRLVGYKLSPFLWKKVRRGLSAGRVQSVAVRLIRDRELEIENFKPDEYWNIDALLNPQGEKGEFTARLAATADGKKLTVTNKQQADGILAALDGRDYTITKIEKGKRRRQPSPPFITSTLQQDASRAFGFSATRTMRAAQTLYEGVDIAGHGTVGLITYMRTDSLRIAAEAQAAAKTFIAERWGDNYVCKTARKWKSRSATAAQDAHEAIRPSNVALYPEMVEHDLTKEQFRLYKLIWSRFIASQMANALYDVTAIEAACGRHVFRATHQSMKFSGFTAIYEEGRDDEQEKLDSPLPDLTPGEALTAAGFDKQQHFTQPPARYTEASLVRAMEEKGVGRPSTYAAIIATIQDREYVVKTDKKLSPTKLGEVVNGLMMDRFPNIISVEFTADMEKQLDQVEAGQRRWKNVLEEFYTDFHQEMLDAEEALKDTRLKVPDEVSEEKCEICGRNLVVKTSRFGKFLACPGYPECKFTKAITEKMPGRCPKCGSAILKRKSKRGYAYYACERGAACGFMTWDVPTDQDCPVCGQTMFKRSGKGAMKPFCANPECSNFLPEDKRGYRRRSTASGEAATAESNAEAAAEAAQKQAEEKKAAKKPAAKKTAEKPAAKKTAAKKSTAKKTAAKKSTAKKTTKKEEPEDDLPF